MLINLLGITHLVKQTTEDTNTAHPENLEGKTSVGSTTTLTDACRLRRQMMYVFSEKHRIRKKILYANKHKYIFLSRGKKNVVE